MTESTVNIETTTEETSAPATGATVPDIVRETGSAQAYRERDPVDGDRLRVRPYVKQGP
jgi:hypothetical protein